MMLGVVRIHMRPWLTKESQVEKYQDKHLSMIFFLSCFPPCDSQLILSSAVDLFPFGFCCFKIIRRNTEFLLFFSGLLS